MSSSKGSKHKQQHGRSRVPVPPEQQQPPAAPNTDLAKLLGNRTRALAAFEDSAFDAGSFLSAYLASLSEKAIDNARQDLSTLLASCTDEVEGVVQQHHARFLAACSGVEALEDQVALLRNYVNGLAALVGSIKGALNDSSSSSSSHVAAHAGGGFRSLAYPQSPLAEAPPGAFAASGGGGQGAPGEGAPSTIQQIEGDLETLLQELDLAAAQRDLPSAVAWLDTADSVAMLLDRDAASLAMEVEDFPGWRHSYDAAVGLRKQRLVFALQRQLADANASPAEVGAAAAALTDLVGEGPALQAMLNCYSHKARLTQALLLKQHTAGSDPNSLEFAGRLVQRTLLLVAAAADTMVATFGVAQRVLGSLFTVWAAREARGCAGLLRHHVLAPATAASSGLTTAVQVASLALVLCAMLEDSHSISLSATMSSELWASIDSALRRHLKRVSEELRMAAAEEVNSLVAATLADAEHDGPAASSRTLAGMPLQVPQLVVCRSLADEVASLAELLSPIANPQLAAMLKRALLDMFNSVTQTITFALKSHMRDGPRAACLSRLLPGIMEGLAGLIEGLPPALAPFASRGGPVLDARAMDRVLNAMYRDVTAAVRSAKAAGKQARQAVAAPL